MTTHRILTLSSVLTLVLGLPLWAWGADTEADTCYKRGNAKYDRGDFNGAIAEYSRAIQLDPKDAVSFYNRGLLKQAKGDLDGAQADFDRAVQLDPKLADTVKRATQQMARTQPPTGASGHRPQSPCCGFGVPALAGCI